MLCSFCRQAYDDVVPYWRMSIRLQKADIPHLEELLTSVSAERITALQYGLMKYYSAFVWQLDPSHGDKAPGPGRAYEYTILSLGASCQLVLLVQSEINRAARLCVWPAAEAFCMQPLHVRGQLARSAA